MVLVNRDTASAAEILTAALKENDLATVVGTRTYGKGVFQEVMDLPAGGALDLTIGQYLTADGTSILRRRGQARRAGGGRPGHIQGRSARPGARGSRAVLSFVGVVGRRGRFLVVEPLFEPGPQVSLGGGVRVRGGEMVLAEQHGARARVLAELGDPARARDVAAAVIYDRDRERGFDGAVEEEARAAAAGASELDPERRDLTALDTFTVDPATARDFDDAVSAAPDGDGIRLWIHIADVAAHVRPGSRLDDEAERRATSVYVPGTVEPMLPAVLSDEACSLAPGVDRLAVTAEIQLAADGAARSARFYRSRVRSDARLSYDQLDEFFAGRERPPEPIAAPLDLARRAAAVLAARRSGSALEISTTEPEFEFDAEGDVIARARPSRRPRRTG